MEIKIKWSEPIEVFKPGKYNTDEKFIEHLRKFIEEHTNSDFEKTGLFMFLSGQIRPEEKLSVVIIEGTADHTIKERLVKKKGHVRELKCLYKNYKDENLYIKIGEIENVELTPEIVQNIVCSLIDYASPSCMEPCSKKPDEKIIIVNEGNFSPLKEIYGKEEEE